MPLARAMAGIFASAGLDKFMVLGGGEVYKQSVDSLDYAFTVGASPETGVRQSCAVSPNGAYIAVSELITEGPDAGDRLDIYEVSGEAATRVAALADTSGDRFIYNRSCFSSDGVYFAATIVQSPHIGIWKIDGGIFTKLTNPATLPAGESTEICFSQDSTYLAVAHASSPYLTIYKRSGDTFTKLSNPASLPAGAAKGVAFSNDSTYLAVAHSASPYVTIYKRSGDTFTKLSNPSVSPGADGNSVAFSHDATYMAVAVESSTSVAIYKRSGDTFTKLSNPASMPANRSGCVAFSADSNYLAIGPSRYFLSSTAYICKRSGDKFSNLVTKSGAGWTAQFYPRSIDV